MGFKEILVGAAGTALFFSCGSAQEKAAEDTATKPNIVIIYMDDLELLARLFNINSR